MRLICIDGPQDQHTAERPSCERITFGNHSDSAQAVFSVYKRTTDLLNGRVVFAYAGTETVDLAPTGIERALLALRLRAPASLVIPEDVEVAA